MPITCAKTQTSAKTHVPLLITRIFMSINKEHIRTYCKESLARVCKQYCIPLQNSTIEHIHSLLCEQRISHTDLLALFFILFNVDTELKNSMMQSDTEQQRRKIGNFSMNMRKHIIPDFLSVDKSTAHTFVTQCSDAWSAA